MLPPHLSDGTSPTPPLLLKTLRKQCPHARIIAQIIEPSNKVHAVRAGADQVICLRQLKAAMIAQTAVCRGVIPFIANLFHSCDAYGSFYDDGVGYELYQVKASEVRLGRGVHLGSRSGWGCAHMWSCGCSCVFVDMPRHQ